MRLIGLAVVLTLSFIEPLGVEAPPAAFAQSEQRTFRIGLLASR